MMRRSAIVLLSVLVVFSLGGILCEQVHAESAAYCCKTSCPKSQHRDPVKCCAVNPAKTTAEVASTHQVAPDPTWMARVSSPAPFSAKPDLRAVAFERSHPPAGLAPSPERLCSLQI
jgi:hypothetical protein